MLRRDDRRRRLALERRRAGDDALDAGDLGGDHRHVGRGEQRIFAAGHVAADRVDRNVLVAEHDARQRLDLDVRASTRADAARNCAPASCANSMSSRLRCDSCDRQSVISASVSRKSSRSQSSNLIDSSRTAASPRFSMSARIPSTVARTFESSSAALRGVAAALEIFWPSTSPSRVYLMPED